MVGFSKLSRDLIVTVMAICLSVGPSMSVAATNKSLRIGISLALTGQYVEPSLMQKRAYELWQDEVNGKGGLLGRQVELVIHDDESNASKAEDIYREFISSNKVDFVFGPYSSQITSAVADEVDAAGFPMLAAGASADEIWQHGYQNIFGMWTPASRYSQGMLRLARASGLSTLAILNADDTFSVEIANGTRKWAPYLKLKIVFDHAFDKDKPDLSEQISQIRAAGADLLIVAGHLNEAILAKQALKDAGWMPRAFFATVGPVFPEWPVLIADAGDLTFATSIWEPNDSFPRSREFAAAFEKRFGVEPSYHAATAYAAGEILESAVIAAASIDRAAVRDALFALDTYSVLGRFAVDRTGIQIKRLDMLIQWQAGQKQIVWPEEIRTRPAIFGPAAP